MKLCAERILFFALITIVAFSIFTVAAAAEVQFEVESMNVKIYRDGLAHVTKTLVIDEIFPEIFFPLLSLSVENLIVLDENQLAVDYLIDGGNLTVFTLGASRVSVEYDTIALTNKEADMWTLILNNPYNLSVFLPQNSTIVYLNQVPITIDATGNKLALSLSPGQWEISYIVPLLPEDQNRTAPWTGIPVEYFIAMAIAVSAIMILTVLAFLRRRKINVNRIVAPHPQLTKEDRAVIEFLAEKEGKAFEAEIRERFPDVPRTSLWRLVRRLERLEIVEVKKIGLENQVQLNR
jgi:uncharacterized membrane protein